MSNSALLTRQIMSLHAEAGRLVESNVRPNWKRFEKYLKDENTKPFAQMAMNALSELKREVGVGMNKALDACAKFFEFVQACDEAITCFRGISENINYCQMMADEIHRMIHEEYKVAIKKCFELSEKLDQEAERAYLQTDRPRNRELYALFHPRTHLATYGALKKEFEKEGETNKQAMSLLNAVIQRDNETLDRIDFLRTTLNHDQHLLRMLCKQGYKDLSHFKDKKQGLIEKRREIAENRKKGAYGGVSFEEYFDRFESFVADLPGSSAELIAIVCAKMALFDVIKYKDGGSVRLFDQLDANTATYKNYLRQWVKALRNYCLFVGTKREGKE